MVRVEMMDYLTSIPYDAWVWWADTLFWHLSLPIISVLVVLELWLTKQRVKRYKAALSDIADGHFEIEYNNVRAQRDRHVRLARETLYGHW